MKQFLTITLIVLCVSACSSTMERLENIGKKPPLNQVDNPHVKEDYRPVSWPLPEPTVASTKTANSLWQPGARGFFRDYRASRVGDILTVQIAINDQARLDNRTERSRTTVENAAAPSLFGFEEKLGQIVLDNSVTPNPASLLSLNGSTTADGEGNIQRREQINTNVAVLVTQVLPNGNLVIDGSQEILVNFEVREIGVRGVIRPEDITSNNTIESTQIAQARITYSGRGLVTDVQQPRWGAQVVDVLSPF
jgi:flagellar L-ring protein precursor FlgH